MEGFLLKAGQWVLTQGPFAVLAAVEAAVIFRLFNLLVESYEKRIEERKTSLEASYKMMSDRASELDRLAQTLHSRRPE